MSRLLDPSTCPDCRSRLDGTRCPGCGLVLQGPGAAELWRTLTRADQLVQELRLATAFPPAAPAPGTVPPAEPPAEPAAAASPATGRLRGSSVPLVLLSLGGLCVLVAAFVFVAVAWDALGLAGRTLVLLGITSLAALSAVAVTRRGLRAAAEALWVVTAGLVTLDLYAGHAAGFPLLGDLGWRTTDLVTGAVVLALGASASLWAATTPTRRLRAGEVVASLGLLLACVGGLWVAENGAVGVAVALVATAGVAALARHRLPVLAGTAAALAAASWLGELSHGLAALSDDVPWYTHLHGWPLLVCSLTAAAATAPSRFAPTARVPQWARAVAAGLAVPPALVLLAGPGRGAQADFVVWSGLLLLTALVVQVGNRPWRTGASFWVVLGVGVLGLRSLLEPALRLAHPAPLGSRGLGLRSPVPLSGPGESRPGRGDRGHGAGRPALALTRLLAAGPRQTVRTALGSGPPPWSCWRAGRRWCPPHPRCGCCWWCSQRSAWWHWSAGPPLRATRPHCC